VESESLVALVEKYIVNNIQCIAEKIATEMQTSLAHRVTGHVTGHVTDFHVKNAPSPPSGKHNNLVASGCNSCSSELARQQRLNRLSADLDSELSAAMCDFGVVTDGGERATAAEFGLWRVGRTELADYSLDRASARLPVTWSSMKTATHSCSAACSQQLTRQQQSRLHRKIKR
jgi:hypothetical protein